MPQTDIASPLPDVSSFWIGAPLSYIEIVCLASFRDAGHSVTLYGLDEIRNVPEGIKTADASALRKPGFEVGNRLRHHNAVYSDLLRLDIIRQTGDIWVDTDAYCLRPLDFPDKYVFGYERANGGQNIANGILGLPQDSPALLKSMALMTDPAPVPPFFDRAERDRLDALRKEGRTWGFENLTWGASGPMLLNHYLQETGEIEHALPPDVLYPGPRAFRRPLLRVPPQLDRLEMPETLSVHIFGKTKRFLLMEHDGLPPKGSYLDLICRRHGIDPREFPISEDELKHSGREKI